MSSKESKAGRGVSDLVYMFGADINLQAVQAMSSKESKAGRGVSDLAYMFGVDINLQALFLNGGLHHVFQGAQGWQRSTRPCLYVWH
ncbi:hypothetical protein EDD22DRAFT_947677 [Suillus occidentalis]|nr:hypothetical protein EDD22DRAFT_947677 [Suillus occidentalis]